MVPPLSTHHAIIARHGTGTRAVHALMHLALSSILSGELKGKIGLKFLAVSPAFKDGFAFVAAGGDAAKGMGFVVQLDGANDGHVIGSAYHKIDMLAADGIEGTLP